MTGTFGVHNLTDEQYAAATSDSPRQLVVASAGSGKTATMVARVVYALATGRVQAHQVLLLAFNRQAAQELDERLRTHMADAGVTGCRPRASTLHAFALDIVQRQQAGPVEVVNDLLPKVLRQLPHQPLELIEQWLFFLVFDGMEIRHPEDFRSGRAWRCYVREQGGVSSGMLGFLTLRHERVDTPLELAVANWLYLHDIHYVYTDRSRSASWQRRVSGWGYRPLSGKRVFALTATGQQVVCLARPERWRGRQDAIVIRLADFKQGRLFERLHEQFRHVRCPPSPARMARVFKYTGLHPGRFRVASLQRSVGLARLRGWDAAAALGQWRKSGRQAIQTPYAIALLEAMITACHQTSRQQSVIDYHGMLEQATGHLRSRRFRHGYRLVLVDEFQDTSRAGMDLLRAMLAQRSDCSLFAVGDDWQSIYGFAGAQADALHGFERVFGAADVFWLTRTFRFDQYLADVTSRFIQRNPAQWVKSVRALQPGGPASLTGWAYTSASQMHAQCQEILQMLAMADPAPRSVLILGRYRHQRPAALQAWRKSFPELGIHYQTVHAAKGREADIVILLGLEQGRYGFPAGQTDTDTLLALVQEHTDTYPFAEERRLFYVALTRARHGVHLLVHASQPSPFVAELGLSLTMEPQPSSLFH